MPLVYIVVVLWDGAANRIVARGTKCQKPVQRYAIILRLVWK